MDIKNIFGFEGKNVAITGSASGMSKDATELLLALGANVYAVDLNDISLPVKAAYKANLGEKEQIEAWINTLPSTIDAVFLCHGIAGSPSIPQKTLEINFFSMQHIVETIFDRLVEKASISIISSCGGYGWQGLYPKVQDLLNASTWEEYEDWFMRSKDTLVDPASPYGTSKQLINAYVVNKCMSRKFIEKKIRINSICPGMTNTGLTDAFNTGAGGGNSEAGAQAIYEIFQKSWGGYNAESREMGYPLVVIGSQICSYMSGQNIYIDYGCCTGWDSAALLNPGGANALESALEADR
jgi:NAD(P)-dependent dehydrogenase (short-subunit alcohol dehydrogenase family)